MEPGVCLCPRVHRAGSHFNDHTRVAACIVPLGSGNIGRFFKLYPKPHPHEHDQLFVFYSNWPRGFRPGGLHLFGVDTHRGFGVFNQLFSASLHRCNPTWSRMSLRSKRLNH